MRVITVIDDLLVVEKILLHLGAWHDPPQGVLSPLGASGPKNRQKTGETSLLTLSARSSRVALQ